MKQILEAIEAREEASWKIGDALLTELGPPGTREEDLEEMRKMSKKLNNAGYVYGPGDLLRFWRVSHAFGPSQRRLGYTLCAAAGTPEILEAIISRTPPSVEITKSYVQSLCYGKKRLDVEDDRKEFLKAWWEIKRELA